MEIHNKAIKAVTESWGKSKDIDKTKPLLQIIQNYLLSMYGNMRTKINISSDHMPNTKGAITYDLFLQLEVCTNMGAWETIEDIEAFREIFEETFNKPFHEYVKEPENRLAYLQSIING